MIVLVAGQNGQVATELRLQGAASSHEVITLGRDKLNISNAELVQQSLAEIQPHILINAAAYTSVDKAEEDRGGAYAVNHEGVMNLATACEKLEIPMLHISTDYVFDGSRKNPYRESDQVMPLGVYGESKWAGEQVLREILPRHLILRTSWVFSAYGHNFLKTMLRIAKDRDALNVVVDQLGSPTSARGIANALLILCDRFEQHNDLAWGTYHFSGQPFTSWHGFASEIICYATDKGLIDHSVTISPITTDQYPTPAKRPANSRLDTEKFSNTFEIPADAWQDEMQQVIDDLAVLA